MKKVTGPVKDYCLTAMVMTLAGPDAPPMVTMSDVAAESGRFAGTTALSWKIPEELSGGAPA